VAGLSLPVRAEGVNLRPVRILAALGAVAMVAVIGHAFVTGDFFGEGKWLFAHPWGRVSLVDLYVGFAIVGCWIAARERTILRTVPWILALVFLGSLATCAYVLIAVRQGMREPAEPSR
jgi:hypothetical protein